MKHTEKNTKNLIDKQAKDTNEFHKRGKPSQKSPYLQGTNDISTKITRKSNFFALVPQLYDI